MITRHKTGFTLLELILVIGIIGVLAAISVAAVNPLRQLGLARGRERDAEANALQKAVMQSIIKGETYPTAPVLKSNAVDICQPAITGTTCTVTNAGFDLSDLVPDYLADIPVDSSQTGSIFTGYRFYRDGAYFFVCSIVEDPACGP